MRLFFVYFSFLVFMVSTISKANEYDKKLDTINRNLGILHGRQQGVKIDVRNLEKNIEEKSKQIEKNAKDIKEIEEKSKQIEKKIRDVKKNENLEGVSQIKNNFRSLNNKINYLENKMNKGFSLMAAMSAMDLGNAREGAVVIGAGVGHYENSQAVAVGVAYVPSKNTKIGIKYSVNTDDIHTSAVGIGISHELYNFR